MAFGCMRAAQSVRGRKVGQKIKRICNMGSFLSCASVDVLEASSAPPSKPPAVAHEVGNQNPREPESKASQTDILAISPPEHAANCRFRDIARKRARRQAVWAANFQGKEYALCPICLDTRIDSKTFRVARFTFSGQLSSVPVCSLCKKSWSSIIQEGFV